MDLSQFNWMYLNGVMVNLDHVCSISDLQEVVNVCKFSIYTVDGKVVNIQGPKARDTHEQIFKWIEPSLAVRMIDETPSQKPTAEQPPDKTPGG